jgi:hypothetical protein
MQASYLNGRNGMRTVVSQSLYCTLQYVRQPFSILWRASGKDLADLIVARGTYFEYPCSSSSGSGYLYALDPLDNDFIRFLVP